MKGSYRKERFAIDYKKGDSMKRYKIPYAVSNYAKLREEGFYYVDKTVYIDELEKYQVPVFLRPRRFGKSLLCTTLESYYDLNQAGRFERLFGDT